MSGQFNDPIRVVAFNTLEHWSEDVTEYIAFEIQTRCVAVPEHILMTNVDCVLVATAIVGLIAFTSASLNLILS
jgi:hypothetical protein